MIIQKLNKLLILLISVPFLFCLPLFSDVLSDQSLNNDLQYYKRTSAQKKLDANDRAYILKRIEEKYSDSGIDTEPLKLELEKVANGSFAQEQESAAPERTISKQNKKTAATKVGKVEKIFVSESTAESKIIIAATGVSRSNYFLMKDPSATKPPRIVLDLYGAQSGLIKAARNISPKEGLFSNVSSDQFEGPPDNIVRIIAELRKDAPYKVRKEGDIFIISVEKNAPGQKQPEPVEEGAGVAAVIPVAQPQAPGTAEKTDPPASVESSSSAAATTDLSANKPEATETVSKDFNNDYKIENGDILGITIYPSDELSREVIVQPDGNISFPLIGSTHARGLTIKQLETNLAQNLGRYVSTPQVSITVKQFSRRQIFIMGEVKSVGAYNYKENLRLLEFISSIGGFADTANRREIKIYRGPPTKRQIHTVNVEEIVKTGDFSRDFLLESGDIIEVTKGVAKIAILGDIRNPGYYDYKDNLQLIELISQAGGFSDTANITDVSIIHPSSENKQTVIKVNLKKILAGKQKDVSVQSGDTVFIPKLKLATANWFLNNIMPWLSLISILVVIKLGL